MFAYFFDVLQVIKFIEEGHRLAKPPGCPDVSYKQMLKCWSKDPKERPTFSALNLHFEKNEEYASISSMMKEMRK